MSGENKIVLVSDNITAKELLIKKINLLREADSIESFGYSSAVSMISNSLPELVILYTDLYNTNCFNVLRELKNIPDFESVPVLLVCEKIEQEFILNAFDEGVADYISIDADNSEFLIRIIWCLQKSVLMKKHLESMKQLVNLDVLNANTYFYKEAFVDNIFKAKIKKRLEQNAQSSLMIITSDINCKHKLSASLLGNILKETLRATDIVGLKEEDKFYILLSDCNKQNAEALFNRIQKELLEDYSISAGVAVIGTDSFEKAENDARKALQEALLAKNTIVFYGRSKGVSNADLLSEETDMTSPNKNFKLFKQSFIKKLHNVITPVFYQVQKMYEDNLFNSHIEQTSTEGNSIFNISSKNANSTLTITYPGFSKINIKTEHKTVNDKKTNSISLKLPELDSVELTKILEQFIKEYKEISGN